MAAFGLDFSHDRTYYKKGKKGDSLYTSPSLDELWSHGDCTIGELSYDSAAYIARYIQAKVTGKKADRHYGLLVNKQTGEVKYRRKPEYITMSRNPGIGAKWIEKWMADVYPSDEVIVKGKSQPPPKYYDQRYEDLDPQGFKKIKAKRIKRGLENASENTWERLAIREECAKASTRELEREI